MEIVEDFLPKGQIPELKRKLGIEFGGAELKSWIDLTKENKQLLLPFVEELGEIPSDIYYVNPVWKKRDLPPGLIYSFDTRLNVIIGKKTYFLDSNSVGIFENPAKIPHEPYLLNEEGKKEKSKNVSFLALSYPQIRKGNYRKDLLKELYQIKDLLFLIFDYLKISDLMILFHSDPFLFRKFHGPENDFYWTQMWSQRSIIRKTPEEIRKILVQVSCDFENLDEFRKREELGFNEDKVADLIKIKYGMDKKLELRGQLITQNMLILAIKYKQPEVLKILLPLTKGDPKMRLFRIDTTPEVLDVLLNYIEKDHPEYGDVATVDTFETASSYGNFESMSYLLKRYEWDIKESPNRDEKEIFVLKTALMYIQIGGKIGFLQYFEENAKILLRENNLNFELGIIEAIADLGSPFNFYLRIVPRDRYSTVLKYFRQYFGGVIVGFFKVLFNSNLDLIEYLLQHDLKLSIDAWSYLNKDISNILVRTRYSLLAKYYLVKHTGIIYALYDMETKTFKKDSEVNLKELNVTFPPK